jgi:hypothetical protein
MKIFQAETPTKAIALPVSIRLILCFAKRLGDRHRVA